MSSFDCPRCSKTFFLKRSWVYHLEHKHGVAPVPIDPTLASPSQATTSGPSISTPYTPPADDITLAVGRFKVPSKVRFRVAYDLGRGDEAQPIRVTIQKDESYDMFLRRLHSVFYGDSFERSLRQWEYVLVNRQYEKGHPLPLTSSNTYYAMVSELLKPRSRYRHAVVRRSYVKNPIIRAIAEGAPNPTPKSPIVNTTAIDTSLPTIPPILDASQPGIPTVDASPALPVADVSEPGISIVDSPPVANIQPDISIADTPMSDAPTDQATPELLTSEPPRRTWVVTSASTKLSSRTNTPGSSPSKASTQELSTPSTPVASARGRRSLQLGSPLASATRARDPMQSYLPLIGSPLAPVTSEGGRRSTRLGSPITPVTRAPRPSQLSPLLAPVASAQAPPAILAIASSPSSPQDPVSEVGLVELSSPLAPALIAPRSPATAPIASGSAYSPTPVLEILQRLIYLYVYLPRTSSTNPPNAYPSTPSALVDHLETASKQRDRI